MIAQAVSTLAALLLCIAAALVRLGTWPDPPPGPTNPGPGPFPTPKTSAASRPTTGRR